MPQIRVKNGSQKGKILQIEGTSPIVIGRDPDTGLQIVDKGVSRQHAEIFRVGEMVFIRDLGSRNGTFINGEKLEEELLREGDQVRVGTTQLVFESSRTVREVASSLKYEDSGDFRTSLELKLDDLFVGEGASTGREREHFRAICQATRIVHTERDSKKRLEQLMDLIQEYIPADHLYLFIKDPKTGTIAPQATREKDEGGEIPISRTILHRVVSEARAILTADAMQDERFKRGDSIVLNQIRSVLCVPIQAGKQNLGAIYAVNARVAETFDETDMQLLTAIGSQLAFEMERVWTIESRAETVNGLLERIMALLEKRDTEGSCHAERVSRYAVATGKELGLPEAELHSIRLAGLLHNIGHLPSVGGVPKSAGHDGVAHVLRVEEIFCKVPGIDPILDCVRSYKERYDGEGKPHGLKGEVIPLGARILAVANRFDQLLEASKKEGSQPESDGTVVKAIFTDFAGEGGKAFDMAVVQALMVAFRHGSIFPEKPKRPIEEVEVAPGGNVAGTSKVQPIRVDVNISEDSSGRGPSTSRGSKKSSGSTHRAAKVADADSSDELDSPAS